MGSIYDPVTPIEPMKKLPKFEYGSQYEIQVSRPVELAKDFWARPSSGSIVVDGDKAEEIKDAILTAKKL